MVAAGPKGVNPRRPAEQVQLEVVEVGELLRLGVAGADLRPARSVRSRSSENCSTVKLASTLPSTMARRIVRVVLAAGCGRGSP